MAQPSLHALHPVHPVHAFHPLHEFHALRVPPPQYPELIGADTDELSVVLRFVDGDRLAFEHLLALYWRPVLAFSTRLLHDGEAADDVAQETFLRLWVNRAGIQPEQLRAYIFRVARNLVIDETRRRSLRARAIDTAGLPPDTQRPDQVAERGEQHDAIQHAIDALPPRRREAFILAYLHELSYKEAAVVLDVSPATVKNHVAMALVDLRRSLARHAHPCA